MKYIVQVEETENGFGVIYRQAVEFNPIPEIAVLLNKPHAKPRKTRKDAGSTKQKEIGL